jgi:hypothetical protein
MDNFKECPHNPILTIDTRDGNKPEWVEIDEHELHIMFEGLYDYVEDGEIDNLDWSRLNFEIYDEEWYREKFPGFPDEWYSILVNSTKEENKVVDYRQHPLKIDRKEVVLKFD